MKRIFFSICLTLLSVFADGQEICDTVVVTDDWRYEGQWPTGIGVRYSEKRGLYMGLFNEGEPAGMCLYISVNKAEVYYGNIKDGKRHGYGVLSRPGGFYYEGNFEDGYFEGIGRMYYPDLAIYHGLFHLGKPTFESAKVYGYTDKNEFAGLLPKIPAYELTKVQKKFLKMAQKKKAKAKILSDDYVMPTFMGADPNEFSRWVNSKLVYPFDAKNRMQQGTVKVSFTVLRTGELANPFVVVSSGVPSLDVEAMRVVCMSPDWTPGKKNGEYVDVTYTFPVIFAFR